MCGEPWRRQDGTYDDMRGPQRGHGEAWAQQEGRAALRDETELGDEALHGEGFVPRRDGLAERGDVPREGEEDQGGAVSQHHHPRPANEEAQRVGGERRLGVRACMVHDGCTRADCLAGGHEPQHTERRESAGDQQVLRSDPRPLDRVLTEWRVGDQRVRPRATNDPAKSILDQQQVIFAQCVPVEAGCEAGCEASCGADCEAKCKAGIQAVCAADCEAGREAGYEAGCEAGLEALLASSIFSSAPSA